MTLQTLMGCHTIGHLIMFAMFFLYTFMGFRKKSVKVSFCRRGRCKAKFSWVAQSYGRCYKILNTFQGSKIVLVRWYLRVSQAAGQVNILIFLLKIKFSPCMPINFVMQGKCLFSDISRPALHFLFTNKMLVIRTGINKMLVRIANREDPDQTASSEAV